MPVNDGASFTRNLWPLGSSIDLNGRGLVSADHLFNLKAGLLSVSAR
jgi:hypothetical protein